MAYNGLSDFVNELINRNQLSIIDKYANPDLEITEITDRVVKENGQALLFTENGTGFPLLINMFGSDERMSLALGRPDLEDAGKELESLFEVLKSEEGRKGFKMLSNIGRLAGIRPKKIRRKGKCQEIILREPDLDLLPVMKCWPYDGGKFITLPVVHTIHPETGETNAGMYRMQLFDKKTTGMHWHRHKTGAIHYEAWKKNNQKMPVTVTLGGDPVYTYAATAPLPQGVDEYLLAGWLRKSGVKMVKCLTNDLWIPGDADIVIEGYVDPSEGKVEEGPFGDHTGFYSLTDRYPLFHVTCITHRKNAIYPSTIVGIPPMEDSLIGLATERLFLYPIKIGLQPEIVDIHLPDPGVAHNLVLVSIKKDYPGQGMKVINGLFGAGQMMFSKFIVVVDSNVNLKNYRQMAETLFLRSLSDVNTIIGKGPLDVLDHSSDEFCYGGKMGIDATGKPSNQEKKLHDISTFSIALSKGGNHKIVTAIDTSLLESGLPVIFIEVDKKSEWKKFIVKAMENLQSFWIFAVDRLPSEIGIYIATWQVLSNTDPARDITFSNESLLVDATSKSSSTDKFSRRWPNVVVSDQGTITMVDSRWDEMGLGEFIDSPSKRASLLLKKGDAEVKTV